MSEIKMINKIDKIDKDDLLFIEFVVYGEYHKIDNVKLDEVKAHFDKFYNECERYQIKKWNYFAKDYEIMILKGRRF